MTYASENNFNQTVSLLAYRCLHRKACLIHRRYNDSLINEKLELYLLMHYMAFYNRYYEKMFEQPTPVENKKARISACYQ